MDTRAITIPYQNKDIKACLTSASNTCRYAVILTHGAGGDIDLPQLVTVTNTLASHGFLVLRFTCKGLNINYRVKIYRQVLNYLKWSHSEVKGCIVGGRSMGARAALMLENSIQASEIESFVLGVMCISYPLHKPNATTELRDLPIKQLTKPALFISGTNDNMCNKTMLESILRDNQYVTVVWANGGDHGLAKASKDVEDSVRDWCLQITQNEIGDGLHCQEIPMSEKALEKKKCTKRKISDRLGRSKRKK